ncbi:sensor histidine kinase [Saccharomonospora sp. NPDC006951]
MKPPGRLSRWIHLIYLVNLLWGPIFDRGSGVADWALVAGIVIVFLPMYAASWRWPSRARWIGTVPTTVLAALTTPFNAGAAILFVYAAAFAGFSESRRTALRWFIGLSALLSLFSVLSFVPMPWRLYGLIPSLIYLWVIGSLQISWSERERAEAETRMRNARVEHLATIAERERIARDLHDLLGHSLTAIIVRAQLAGELLDRDNSRAGSELTDIEHTARTALSEIRATLAGWRNAGLDAELESATETLTTVGVTTRVRRDATLAVVGSTEHELALALREAVTNVARHARATTCHIDVGVVGDDLRLVIADDGLGAGSVPEGNGLTGIRERISALGGSVEKTADAGTTVAISVPLRVAT